MFIYATETNVCSSNFMLNFKIANQITYAAMCSSLGYFKSIITSKYIYVWCAVSTAHRNLYMHREHAD